jgi:hypothetical protein
MLGDSHVPAQYVEPQEPQPELQMFLLQVLSKK